MNDDRGAVCMCGCGLTWILSRIRYEMGHSSSGIGERSSLGGDLVIIIISIITVMKYGDPEETSAM